MAQSTSPFITTIRECNRQAKDAWGRFAAHRAHLTGILSACAQASSSLCLLGAGNLNDVRLAQLLGLYREVHLVDIDIDAVHSGLSRQGFAHSKAVRVHRPLDLTGILCRLPTSTEEGMGGQASVSTLIEALALHRCSVSGQPFGVTVSCGVLTQLLQSVIDSSLKPSDVVRVSLALRDKHLADLVELTQSGGTAVLITDVVPTTTAPALLEATASGLEEQMAKLVADRNFFTGVNPYRIVALLEEDERFSRLMTDVRLIDPWLWGVTADRQHLTCAIVARRRSRRIR